MTEITEKTMRALEKNRMQAFYAETKEDVLPIVQTLIKKGDSISCGGSVTLSQTGISQLISNGEYVFLDRNRAGITPAERDEVYSATVNADAYFCSSNAVTINGELVNVDGFGNRCASIMFGPKSVIMVVSVNKIVPDIQAAFLRIKTVAAPKNCVRLNKNTYCAAAGECVSLKNGNAADMTAGCDSPDRICGDYLVSGRQMIKNRIKVILCGEPLGF